MMGITDRTLALVAGEDALADEISNRLEAQGIPYVRCLETEELAALDQVDDLVVVCPQRARTPFLECSFEEWRANARGGIDFAIHAAQLALERMGAQEGDKRLRHMVFVAPEAEALHASDDVKASMTCFGLRGLARHLALELAPSNILVNLVAAEHDASHVAEAADTVVLLLSPDAGNVTGSTILVGQEALAY